METFDHVFNQLLDVECKLTSTNMDLNSDVEGLTTNGIPATSASTNFMSDVQTSSGLSVTDPINADTENTSIHDIDTDTDLASSGSTPNYNKFMMKLENWTIPAKFQESTEATGARTIGVVLVVCVVFLVVFFVYVDLRHYIRDMKKAASDIGSFCKYWKK